MKNLTQQMRLVILILYILILLCISKYVFGTLLPPNSENGLWFYSGFAALLLGSLLLEPYFSNPNECAANGVTAIISILSINIFKSIYTSSDQALWISVMIYAIIIIVSSIIAIAFKDSTKKFWHNLSLSSKLLSENIGKPRIVFSVVYWFSLIVFHRDDSFEFLSISISWAAIIVARPLEHIISLIIRWIQIFRSSETGEKIGKVIGYQHPSLSLIQKEPKSIISFGEILALQGDDGQITFSMTLDHVGFSDGYLFRSINLLLPKEKRDEIERKIVIENSSEQIVYKVDQEFAKSYIHDIDVYNKRSSLVGLVATNSDITTLIIDLVRYDLEISEGRLFEVQIGNKLVLFVTTQADK